MDDPDSISYPEGLRREAERSVARGFSGSDSNVAKVKAADALLTKGTDLPKSVQAYAQRAVNKGAFSKEFPPSKGK